MTMSTLKALVPEPSRSRHFKQDSPQACRRPISGLFAVMALLLDAAEHPLGIGGHFLQVPLQHVVVPIFNSQLRQSSLKLFNLFKDVRRIYLNVARLDPNR